MFHLLKLKWQKEFEELKSLHKIQLAEKDAERKLLENELKQTHELKLKEAVTLLKLNSEQTTKQLELDYNRKLDEQKKKQETEMLNFKEIMIKEHYDKLSTAMARLHEEGNVTTKFVQDLAVSMFEKAPTTKVKVTLQR